MLEKVSPKKYNEEENGWKKYPFCGGWLLGVKCKKKEEECVDSVSEYVKESCIDSPSETVKKRVSVGRLEYL